MDQMKIGSFLKELRKEKGLTQEQLAEQLNIAGRTVSRWETGRNMPDISTLVELADYFQVSLTEIIDGEGSQKNMELEEKETLLKIADYSENERNVLMKRVLFISVLGLAALLLGLLLSFLGVGEWNSVLLCLEGICFGLAVGALITSVFFTAGVLSKLRSHARVRNLARILRIICPVIVALCLVVCMIATVCN